MYAPAIYRLYYVVVVIGVSLLLRFPAVRVTFYFAGYEQRMQQQTCMQWHHAT